MLYPQTASVNFSSITAKNSLQNSRVSIKFCSNFWVFSFSQRKQREICSRTIDHRDNKSTHPASQRSLMHSNFCFLETHIESKLCLSFQPTLLVMFSPCFLPSVNPALSWKFNPIQKIYLITPSQFAYIFLFHDFLISKIP